jgi:hypothetical protein
MERDEQQNATFLRPEVQGTELCHRDYMGVLCEIKNDPIIPIVNHSLDMGLSGKTYLRVNASRVPRDLSLGRSLYMRTITANHNCVANFEPEVVQLVPEGYNNDFHLLIQSY